MFLFSSFSSLSSSCVAQGPQDRASLWALLKAKEDSSIRSKRHMKRVMRELVRRDVINAKADVSKIRDLTSGAHNKLLSSKNTPPYIWKLKHSKRYGESSSPVAEEHQ